jgi:GNAT superfamily N-acetyltransferase
VTATIAPPRIEIRVPTRSELRGCRMILPEALAAGVRPDLLLAAEPSPVRYLGVLAYDLVLHGGRLGWRVRMHVVVGRRRRGIGARLIAAIAERARNRGAGFLVAEVDGDDASAAAFLAVTGFRAVSRCTTYEADLAAYRRVAGSIRDRLAARGRLPEGARVVAPRQAPSGALEWLDEERRGHAIVPAAEIDGEGRGPSTDDVSSVLVLDGRAIGGVVARVRGDVAEVAWRSVLPEYRGGWANVVLAAGSADRLAAQGVRRVRFSTTDDTPDTENGVRIHGFDHRAVVVHHRLEITERSS